MNAITLTVPKSCNKQWNTLTPQSGGGYCSSCEKTVVDFTNMSDDDILRYFSVQPSHTCGRFRPEQLKTYVGGKVVKVKPGLTLFKAGFFSLVMLLLSRPASAQPCEIRTTQTEISLASSYSIGNNLSLSSVVITGVVKDEDNMVLPGVNVLVRGTTQGTVTDVDGRFQIAAEPGDVLVFSFIGLDIQEYAISEGTRNNIEITMTMNYAVLMGEVAVDRVYGDQSSALSRIWNNIKALF